MIKVFFLIGFVMDNSYPDIMTSINKTFPSYEACVEYASKDKDFGVRDNKSGDRVYGELGIMCVPGFIKDDTHGTKG
jgi:hypothetical protein